jgi:hypothetical protein
VVGLCGRGEKMTTFLNVLDWTAIVLGTVGSILTLIRLTVGDAARGKAKPGARASAWRLLCYSLGVTLGSASHLVNGKALWLPLGLSFCLIVFAFSWDVRLLLRPASHA